MHYYPKTMKSQQHVSYVQTSEEFEKSAQAVYLRNIDIKICKEV